MFKHVFLVLGLVACLALAQPPLPPAVHTTGNDCQTKYLSGSDILIPDRFGDTNAYCTDSRGCDWHWNISITPCTQTLLSFEARVGASLVDFSIVGPTTTATLEFRCVNSGSGVTMVIKPIASAAIMEWRYSTTTCDQLLSSLQDSPAPFDSHSVAVYLPASSTEEGALQMWYSNSKEAPTVLDEDVGKSDAGCQKMCFTGLEQQDQVTIADWKFCYDTCKEKMQGGGMDLFLLQAGQSVRVATPMKSVEFGCEMHADKGQTRLTLHGARKGMQAWSTWTFNAVACSDLMTNLLKPVAQRVYIQHDFSMQVDGGETVQLYNERDLAMFLGHLSTDQTVSSASSSSKSGLSSLEIALIVVVSVLVCVLLIIGLIIAYRCMTRKTTISSSGAELLKNEDDDDDTRGLMARLKRMAPTLRFAAEMIDHDELERLDEKQKRADAVAKTMKLSDAQKRAVYADGEDAPAKMVPYNARMYMDREDFKELQDKGLVLPEPK